MLTSWEGKGLFSYVNREEGEQPRVHRIMTVGHASGTLFSSFLIQWKIAELFIGGQNEFTSMSDVNSELA